MDRTPAPVDRGLLINRRPPLKAVTAFNSLPVPNFTADATFGYIPFTVSFTDLTPGSPFLWNWDFGDTSSSTDQFPSNTYDTVGQYSVSLSTTFGEPKNLSWSFLRASSNGQYIVAGARNDFIYTSYDYGATWVQRTFSTQDWAANASMSANGQHIMASVYDNASPIVHISHDYGVNWTIIDLGVTYGLPWAIHSTPTSASTAISDDGITLLAADYNGSVYTSTDSGGTWTAHTINGYFLSYGPLWAGAAMSSNGSDMAIADYYYGYIHTSSDSGSNWTTQLGSGNRVWYSVFMSDNGQNLTAAVIDPSGPPNGFIYTSGDYGVTWVSQPGAVIPTVWGLFGMSGDGSKLIGTVYISDPPNATNFLNVSTDGGVSWNPVGPGQVDSWADGAVSDNGANIVGAVSNYVNPTGFIYGSNDFGNNFRTLIFPTGTTTTTKHDYISVSSITADFTSNFTEGEEELTVKFEDLSVGSPSFWSWNFGDGNISIDHNPTNTYKRAGTYTVSLYVSNEYGNDTKEKIGYITVTKKFHIYSYDYITGQPIATLTSLDKLSFGDNIQKQHCVKPLILKFVSNEYIHATGLRMYLENKGWDGNVFGYYVSSDFTSSVQSGNRFLSNHFIETPDASSASPNGVFLGWDGTASDFIWLDSHIRDATGIINANFRVTENNPIWQVIDINELSDSIVEMSDSIIEL